MGEYKQKKKKQIIAHEGKNNLRNGKIDALLLFYQVKSSKYNKQKNVKN